MDNIRNIILDRIKEVSKKYQYYGFWKCKAAYVYGVNREDNPFLHFPSEEYCYNALMKEYNNLTDDNFTAKLVDDSISFRDGDELDIPFELFKQKLKISIDIEYNSDGPYGILYIIYKTEETEKQISQRLFGKIFMIAQNKYILENFT